MPRQNGKHRVYIYFNGYDIKGSPYIMRVGTKGRSGKTRCSPIHESSRYRSESPSMHFNSSSMLKNTDNNVRRELYSPQNVQKSGSYSPQLSPTYGEDRDYIKTSKEIYSSNRLSSPKRDLYSPKRDLYSPKLVDEQQHGYSTVYKSELHKEIRKSQSPAFDYSHNIRDSYNSRDNHNSRDSYNSRDNHNSRDTTDLYSKKNVSNVSKINLTSARDDNLYSSSYVSKMRNDNSYGRKSDSPVLMSSPINVSFVN